MGYTIQPLFNNKTRINRELLQPMQEALKEAHDKLSTAVFAVLTPEKMDEILANATKENVGINYMYLGETTESYKKGAVYTVEEV